MTDLLEQSPKEDLRKTVFLLTRTKELLISDGWLQNTYQILGEGRCLTGAIHVAANLTSGGRCPLHTDPDCWNQCVSREYRRLADIAFLALAVEMSASNTDAPDTNDANTSFGRCLSFNDNVNQTLDNIVEIIDKAIINLVRLTERG